MLPHDLDVALKYLSEGELARLREAVAFETRRRSLAAAGKGIETPVRSTPDKPALAAGSGQTTSQINLIRSSIKAGVKPTVLARQFGLSRAQIQAALSGS